MWTFEHSQQSTARRERVWALLVDVEGWPAWNPGVVQARPDGPFAEGAQGSSRAAGRPPSDLRIVSVDPERGFAHEVALTGVRVRFEWALDAAGDGTLRVTQRVRMHGPATALYRRTVGRRLATTIPEALAALVARAEAH